MTNSNVLRPLARANAIVAAAVLASATLLPVLLMTGSASGAQLENRFIDISGSSVAEGSGRTGDTAAGQDVTYTVGFDIPTAHTDLEGIVVEFCSNSPIIGDSCTAPTGFDLNIAGPLALANQVGISGFAVDITNSTASKLILTNALGTTISASTTVSFDLGTVAVGDGITNPTSEGTFFARILTYTTVAAAQGYTSVDPAAVAANIDDGGIALSIASELTITARVQEVLVFCVGTDDGSTLASLPADDCSLVGGTDIDLGVVDSQAVNDSTTEGSNGIVMIRTNAANGAVVYYKAEQDQTSGQLKIAGTSCISAVSLEDPCFNSAGATKTVFAAGTEMFGMALRNLSNASGGATSNLTCTTEYNGNGTDCIGAPTGYTWLDDGTFASIASSASVLDDETFSIEFAATAAPTTPTGLYTVTANFVATSTF